MARVPTLPEKMKGTLEPPTFYDFQGVVLASSVCVDVRFPIVISRVVRTCRYRRYVLP